MLSLFIFISEVNFHGAVIGHFSKAGAKICIEASEVEIGLVHDFVLVALQDLVITVFLSHLIDFVIPVFFKRENRITVFAGFGPELRRMIKTFHFQAFQLSFLIFLSSSNIRTLFEITLELDSIRSRFLL